jgi:hypothetical protein
VRPRPPPPGQRVPELAQWHDGSYSSEACPSQCSAVQCSRGGWLRTCGELRQLRVELPPANHTQTSGVSRESPVSELPAGNQPPCQVRRRRRRRRRRRVQLEVVRVLQLRHTVLAALCLPSGGRLRGHVLGHLPVPAAARARQTPQAWRGGPRA